jgi:hypothetical protein
METNGYVYCLENESMPGLVKIGYTDRTMEERLQEANNSGTFGPPTEYKIVFAKFVKEPRVKESILHTLLSRVRRNPKKEFFTVSADHVKLYFELLDGEWYIGSDCIDEEHCTQFLNTYIFSSTSTSSPVTIKSLTEALLHFKQKNKCTITVHAVQKLIREAYGPPSSKGWNQIRIFYP